MDTEGPKPEGISIKNAPGMLKYILFFFKTEFPYQGCYDCA